MSTFIDRRLNPKGKSLVNRQRFLRRAKEQIRDAVKKSIEKTDIKDIGAPGNGGGISIPSKGIKEPHLINGNGGKRERVFPGNKEYSEGDAIQKPQGGDGKGRGRKASDSGDGEDEFHFTLTRDEFLDVFFEDLELPEMIKKQLKSTKSVEMKRGGYTTVGSPTNLNIHQTMRHALGRRIALRRPKSDELKAIELQIFDLEKKSPLSAEDAEQLDTLRAEAARLSRRMKGIPFVDPVDVRYNVHIPTPMPSTQAVMFCLMDVSGSMTEHHKDLAKRFFMLLYLFLQRQYDKIDIVFIRHTHEAEEVDEQTFFYDRSTGGTVVSSCLNKMDEIIAARYPLDEWNIYAAQASDGDNSYHDNEVCVEVLNEKILPKVQYFAYIEILDQYRYYNDYGNDSESLWSTYTHVAKQWKHLITKKIAHASDIYPVFRELFKKEK